MTEFSYRAFDSGAQLVCGSIRAANRVEALRVLSDRLLKPVELAEDVNTTTVRRIRPAALAAAFSMLADQIDAGVSILNALRVLENQVTDAALKVSVSGIAGQVANGSGLADAMEEQANVFGALEVSMIRAGEEGAFLPESLRRIASVRERREETRSRIVGALAYPSLLVVVGGIVVSGMLIFFVPRFEPLFESLRRAQAMPLPTTILLAVSGFMQTYGLWVLLSTACMVFLFRGILLTPAMRHRIDQFTLNLPFVGEVLRDFGIAQFCRVLGSLLQNGVPMLRALDISGSACGNQILGQAIRAAAESVTTGKSLAGPLADSGRFPGEVLEMISVAEQSNKLETVLLKISAQLESRSQRRLDLFVKMMEPALMLIMALMVGFLVVALLMPIFESNGLV